jgi:hypothetical protein
MKASMVLWLAWTMILLGGLHAGAARAEWSGEQAQLVALSDAWIDAEVKHDKAALERILDERFLATFASSGKTIDRAAYIAWILQTELEPFEVVNGVVNVHGDAALVIATSTDGTTKFTWIAVKKAGLWKVISETFSKVAAQK